MQTQTKQRGLGLIEVIVALFVLGFGIIALAMFSGGLFTETGQVKAKTEALQLAQQQIEQLRDDAVVSGLASLSSTETTVAGVNASYNLMSIVVLSPSTDPEHADITVTATWSDKEGSHSVVLESFISASNPDAIAGLVGDALDGGGFVETPHGIAEYGGDSEVLPDDAVDIQDARGGRGFNIYYKEPHYILADDDDNVLLKSKTLFSSVTGRVYFENGDVDESNIQVKPSDVGVCPKWESGGSTAVTSLPSGDDYFSYTCFFGSGWYGNIGIIRIDRVNSNDRVCMGDPDQSDDSTAESRHPQLLGTRTYRGYTPQFDVNDIDDDGITDEPAIDGSGNRIYLSDGMATGHAYGDTAVTSQDAPLIHDFLLTTITGNPVDSDCQPELVATGTGEYENNHGYFVCVYDEVGNKTCPSVLPQDLGEQVVTTTRTIIGTIAVDDDDTATIADLTITTSQDEECQIRDDGDADTNDLQWGCNIYDAGAGWTGTIELVSDDLEICSSDSFSFTDVTTNLSGYEFAIADSCSLVESNYIVQGNVVNIHNSQTVDLTGASVVTSTGEGSCIATLGFLDDARSGSNTDSYVCVVPANFSGEITLDIPRDVSGRVTDNPDYSGGAVTENLSGQDISVRP